MEYMETLVLCNVEPLLTLSEHLGRLLGVSGRLLESSRGASQGPLGRLLEIVLDHVGPPWCCLWAFLGPATN